MVRRVQSHGCRAMVYRASESEPFGSHRHQPTPTLSRVHMVISMNLLSPHRSPNQIRQAAIVARDQIVKDDPSNEHQLGHY